jgi:hypothetical protein
MPSFESQNVVKFHLEMNEDETYSLTNSQDIIRYYK